MANARRWLWLVALVTLGWAFHTVGATGEALVTGIPAMGRLVGQLFPPDVSPEFLSMLGRPVFETLMLSVLGMGLATIVGVPLALMGTQTLWGGTRALEEARSPLGAFLYHAARRTLDVFRAVPDLAWALLFVAAVGLGSLPALIALGISYAGMLGKGVSEILEGVDPTPAAALRGSGAGRLGAMVWAVVPQAWSQIVAYTFYCWECSMRASALMGFVGAGGIGYQIDLSMRMFEFRQVSTLIAALLLLIGLVDLTSHLVRRSLLGEPSVGRRRFGRALTAGLALLFVGGMASMQGAWGQLFTGQAARNLGRFTGGFWPMATGSEYVQLVVSKLAETLAISVAATAIGALLAFLFCVPAARAETFLLSPPSGPIAGLLRTGFVASRAVLNLLRSVPEVLWALLLIVAVGLGPFAGALALSLHTGGVLGKLYAEALEEADYTPVHALLGMGAPVASAIAYAALPVALPTLLAFTLLRWEVNLRVATILGFVGGGGLGQELWNQIQLGFYDRVATILVVIFAVVLLVDQLSAGLRRSLARV